MEEPLIPLDPRLSSTPGANVGFVFGWTTRSRNSRFAVRTLVSGIAASFLYTAILSGLGEFHSKDWIDLTRQVVSLMEELVPGIHKLELDFYNRGLPDRAHFICNIVPFQWLILGLCVFFAMSLMVKEGLRLRRGFIAARREAHSGRGRHLSILAKIMAPFDLAAFLIFPLLNGDSHYTGKYAYDLADSCSALFFQFLGLTIMWWGIVFFYGFHC